MKRLSLLALFVFVVLSGLVAAPLAQQTPQKPFVPVEDEMLWKPDPANWLSWRRTLDSHGFSPLDQVNRNNVSKLQMVWTRPMGTGNQESTPLVYNGVMYVPNSGDYIQAFDAKTGAPIWENRRDLRGGRGSNNRNIAIWGTTIID